MMLMRRLPWRYSANPLWHIRADCETASLAAKDQATSLPQTTEHFPDAHEWAWQAIGESIAGAREIDPRLFHSWRKPKLRSTRSMPSVKRLTTAYFAPSTCLLEVHT